MDEKDWLEIEKRFERLSFDAKVRVIERLVRRLRQGAIDPASFEDGVNAMAADPDVQRELGGATNRQ
jgi:hypothetical protein